MAKKVKNGKLLLAVGAAMVFLCSSEGVAEAAVVPSASNGNAEFSLDTYALQSSQGAKLYVDVSSDNGYTAAPATLKQVQVKISGSDGKLISTKNYHNVSSPGGKAVINLGDVPLNDKVATQVLAQTAQTVNTEVLNNMTAVTDFAVMTNQAVSSDFKGYGAQMNGNVYTALNDPSRGFTGNTPPQDMSSLENKVASLQPGLSRIFLSPKSYPSTDPTVPTDPNQKNMMASFYQTIQLAQKVGADVNVTWWYLPSYTDETQESAAIQTEMQEFANTLTDLIKNHGITVIKQITINNEPNGHKYWNAHMADYALAYRDLDADLKAVGLRKQIKFIGGDLVHGNQATWFKYMANNMGDVLDGWSVHIYWWYFQTYYFQDRLSSIKAIYDSIPANERKPLEVTEYGVRGTEILEKTHPVTWIMSYNPYRWTNPSKDHMRTEAGFYQKGNNSNFNDPSNHNPMIPINTTNIAAFEEAWFNLEAANMGFQGFSKWDMFQAMYDFTYQDYSLIGYSYNLNAKPGQDPYTLQPGQDPWTLRPAYYMEWLFSHAAGQGGQVLKEVGSSGSELITPYKTASGNYSVIALDTSQAYASMNTNQTAASTFSIGNLPANTTFHVTIWNAHGNGKLSSAGTVNSGAAGAVSVKAPAGSIVALTTATLPSLPQ